MKIPSNRLAMTAVVTGRPRGWVAANRTRVESEWMFNPDSTSDATFNPEDGSSSRISFGSEHSARASSITLRTP